MPTARVTLPPEEWADEVQLLNTQLTDCLEQLQRRETELESQDGVIKVYEETLIQVKQQMAALYIEHDSKVTRPNAMPVTTQALILPRCASGKGRSRSDSEVQGGEQPACASKRGAEAETWTAGATGRAHEQGRRRGVPGLYFDIRMASPTPQRCCAWWLDRDTSES